MNKNGITLSKRFKKNPLFIIICMTATLSYEIRINVKASIPRWWRGLERWPRNGTVGC